MSVTPSRFGLDVPDEAGVAPSRRGEGWIGQKPPSATSGILSNHTVAAQVADPERELYRVKNHPEGPALLKSRERDPLLPSSAAPSSFPRPLPFSLPLPPPGSECPCTPRARAAARAVSPGPPLRLTHPPPPRRARRSWRRGRWRRPPAPAVPRGRSEEPEKPTEASREDAAAEDEPAERAVPPVSAGAGPVRRGSWPRVRAWSYGHRGGISGVARELLGPLRPRRGGGGREGTRGRGRNGHIPGC